MTGEIDIINTQQIIASGSGMVVGNTSPAVIQPAQVVQDDKLNTELLQDYNSSRENTNELMEIGKAALQEVLAIASQGQHPRFYEAAALMIKTLNETNMNFMDTQTKLYEVREIKERLGLEKERTDTTKIVFMGTTKDLMEQIRSSKKQKTIEVDSDAI